MIDSYIGSGSGSGESTKGAKPLEDALRTALETARNEPKRLER